MTKLDIPQGPMANDKKPGSKGESQKIQWVIRRKDGSELGPIATPEVLKMIKEQQLLGDEMIKNFPYGRWIAISQQGDFYDSLLSILEGNVVNGRRKTVPRPSAESGLSDLAKDSPASRLEKMDAESTKPNSGLSTPNYGAPDFRPQTRTPGSQNAPTNPHSGSEPPADKKPGDESTSLVRSTGDFPSNAIWEKPIAPTTPVVKQKVGARKERKPKSGSLLFVWLVLVGSLVGVGYYAFFDDGASLQEQKPHLLVPKTLQEDTLSAPELQKIRKFAISNFLLDSFEGYDQAQSSLVKIIEGAPRSDYSLEARGLLCLVYKELWPFVAQDSQDLDAVNYLTKLTRQKDPFGLNSVYCEITRLLILGKFKDAKGALDNALNRPENSSVPILYNLKAEILAGDHDPQTASLYSEKASKLWPEWIKPEFDFAHYLNLAQQPARAVNEYITVLRANPKHKASMLELGILQYKSFHHVDLAIAQLRAGLATFSKAQASLAAKANLTLAEIYFEKADPRRALEYAQKSYELNPADVAAKDMIVKLGGKAQLPESGGYSNEIVYIGDQYFRNGDCLAAQAEYKTAFDLDNANGTAAMKAAKCLWQLNQSLEAFSWLEKAIAADPRLISAYVLAADYYSQRFNFPGAQQALSRGAKISPNNHEILRGFGMVEFRRNNFREAGSFLKRAFQAYENDVETIILLAQVSAALKDYHEAVKYAVRAVELDPSNADAQVIYAKAIAQLDGVDAGASYMAKLISIYAYSQDFRLGLAEVYAESERYPQAQALYQQILDLDPHNRKAMMGLGESFQQQGFADKALRAYLDGALMDPSDAEGLFRAGVVYFERQKYPDAIRVLQQAAKVNPQYPKVYFYQAKAYLAAKNTENALKAIAVEKKINPGLLEAYVLAGEIYSAAHQYSKCAEEYQAALKLRNQGAVLYVNLARCLRQAGSTDIAESMLNIAASQESGLPDIYKEQGVIFQVKGDFTAAIAAYNKYLTLSPDANDKEEIEGQITKLSSGQR